MFYLRLYQGLKPGIQSLRYFFGLFQRGKGGTKIYRGFCNTPHLQEKTKQIKVNEVVQHQKITANG